MSPDTNANFELACERLSADDVVAVPTETVYGLAASIHSERAIRKIFQLKKRPFFDPLIVHVNSFAQARALTSDWPALADFLARTFWPGPLTLVLPKRDDVNPLITSGLPTVAIRHPRHELTDQLIEKVGPLAAPSANRFGHTSPSRAEHVRAEFPDESLLILDGGPCEVGLESTVLSFDLAPIGGIDVIRILRPGGVTEDDLETALKKFSRAARIERGSNEIQAPGQLKHHYMPDIPLVLVDELANLNSRDLLSLIEKNTNSVMKSPVELVLDADPAIAARELYAKMRALADSGADVILVRNSKLRQGGFWDAINDRLSRAATVDLT